MQGRTFFRIMADNLIFNNPFYKAISAIVKFYKEQFSFSGKELKFSQKMPLHKTVQTYEYKKRFIFDTEQASGVSLK